MSYLGVDVGTKRIGLAASESGIIAEPVSSFTYDGLEAAIDGIVQVIHERKATTVVVGVPIRADGSRSEQAQFTERLSETLQRAAPDVAVRTVDEALTSKEAERLGGRGADHDALAAALILEQYFHER